MCHQLNLFNSLNLEDILEFLRSKYPELKFEITEYFNQKVIVQTVCKKVICRFSIVKRSADDIIWCRKFDSFISIDVQKEYGNFEGLAYSSDTLIEFVSDAEYCIATAKRFIEGLKRK